MFFECFVAPEGCSRLAKAAGAEPSGLLRDQMHAVVARSRFRSQNGQQHFILGALFARRCGVKQLLAQKVQATAWHANTSRIMSLDSWTSPGLNCAKIFPHGLNVHWNSGHAQ